MNAIEKQIIEKLNNHKAKCLFIYGKIGCGKTFFIKNYLKTYGEMRLFKYFSMDNLILSMVKGKDLLQNEIEKPYFNLIIDEFGSEIDSKTSVYGNPVKEIIYRHIMLRYDLFVDMGKRTILISNINPDLIFKSYDKRLADRFIEMFDFIEFPGESRR